MSLCENKEKMLCLYSDERVKILWTGGRLLYACVRKDINWSCITILTNKAKKQSTIQGYLPNAPNVVMYCEFEFHCIKSLMHPGNLVI